MHTLKKVSRVPGTLEVVFDFFNCPANLEKLTPSFLRFRVLTPAPRVMHTGAVFDYAIRLMGFPMRWTSIITQYEPLHGFVDIQLRGPYAYWHHHHRFVPRDGHVEVIDEVHYEVGFGIIGRVMHELLIKHQLNAIFSHRDRVMQELFPGSNESKTYAEPQ